MKLKLKDYVDILLEGKYQDSEKTQFKEDIRNFGRFGEHIYNGRGMMEVIEGIKNLTERAQSMALDEAGEDGWFEAVTVKKNMNEVKKDAMLFEKTAKEMGALQQRLEALYEDIAHKIGRYYEVGDLSGKDVLPADNDYTANGEEEEEVEEYGNKMYMGDLEDEEEDDNGEMEEQFPAMPIGASLGLGIGGSSKPKAQYSMGELEDDEDEDMYENFSMNTGNKNLPSPGNAAQAGGNALSAMGAVPGAGKAAAGMANPAGAATLPLGSLMSDEEVNNVKENYWNLQGAQNSLMEDEEEEQEESYANTNESRAEYFHRMKEQLGAL